MRYVELNRKVLITRHAVEQLSARYGDSVKEFISRVGDRLEALYRIIPNHKQAVFTVCGYKLVLEKMDSYGHRCPENPVGDVYLVIVTVLLPTQEWRGDRSKRVRRRKIFV